MIGLDNSLALLLGLLLLSEDLFLAATVGEGKEEQEEEDGLDMPHIRLECLDYDYVSKYKPTSSY